MAQPTGVVTLLFSDVEGSTKLLERLGTERYAEVLELHRRLMREAFARFDGYEFGTEGDAFFVAFAQADGAVGAAGAAQRALAGAAWPEGVRLRVRMGVHTGQPVASGSNYVGMDLHRVARIMSAGHGGQVLISETTRALVDGVGLRDLGPHRLKDLLEPIRLYQLEIEGLPAEFPPLRSLHRSNLPVAAWPLLGRGWELAEIRGLVRDGVRLVTLTGPGGSGKTRLALQAASELSEDFVDGVFFVGLAPVRDIRAARSTVAQALGLGADEDVAGWLQSRRVLLVLDNLEHLTGIDEVVAGLLVGQSMLVCTSRGPLRRTAEQELPVEPLPEAAAVELFVNRAAAAGRRVQADETVAAVCRRLDNLPLAIELAAARTRLLSPSALLQRLDATLPLLTGGAGDRPERQRTLRSTIQWSYELLDPGAQAAFRRLSVFRGSFTLDAAEEVTGAELDHLAALVDQSLLKPLGDERLFMLETLREYAREQLDETGETSEYGHRHARYYLGRLESDEVDFLGSRRPELLTWFAEEEDNLRAMLARLSADTVLDAARALRLLHRYWKARGASEEARRQIRALVANETLPDQARALVLTTLADVEANAGDTDATEAISREALRLAEPGSEAHAVALLLLAFVAVRRQQREEAIRLAREVLREAHSQDVRRRIWLRADAATVLAEAGQTQEARALSLEALEESRRIGDEYGAAITLHDLVQFDLDDHDWEAARQALQAVLDTVRHIGNYGLETEALRDLGLALLGLKRQSEAREVFAELLDRVEQVEQTPSNALAAALAGIALATEPAQGLAAARLTGAVANLRRDQGLDPGPRTERLEAHFARRIIEQLGEEAWTQEQTAVTMSLDETIQLAKALAGAPATPTSPDSEDTDPQAATTASNRA